MAKLSLKVVPSSAQDQVVGWLGDALKIKVRAPPEKGRANRAVIALLSAVTGIDRNRFEIVAGQTASAKVVQIRDLDEAQLARLFPPKT